MKISFYKPSEIERPLRLSVHRSGRLGFSKEAETKLNLNKNKFMAVGRNAEDENDKDLYLAVFSEESKDQFKVSKAGQYYSLNLKLLFDKLKLNYSTGQLAFDMSTIQDDGETYYRLKQVDRNTKSEKSTDIDDLL